MTTVRQLIGLLNDMPPDAQVYGAYQPHHSMQAEVVDVAFAEGAAYVKLGRNGGQAPDGLYGRGR